MIRLALADRTGIVIAGNVWTAGVAKDFVSVIEAGLRLGLLNASTWLASTLSAGVEWAVSTLKEVVRTLVAPLAVSTA